MSIPSSYNQIVSSPIGVPVKITGGVRTPFVFTVGMAYRFHNFGSNSAELYAASSGGSALLTVAAGSTGDYTATQDTYWLLESTTSNLLVEPLITTFQSGVAMSPLSYVVQMATTEGSTLIGTFFGVAGAPLSVPGTGDAIVQIAVSTDPETIGYLLFGSNKMWVDAVEFRGVLQGGPLLVGEASPTSNTSTPTTGYLPLINGLEIQPGPVIIGTGGVTQSARNTGTCVEPPGANFDSTIHDGSPAIFDVDVVGATLTRIFVEWNLSSEVDGDITVSAYPACYPDDQTPDPVVSANPVVQETFTLESGSIVNHIELDPGKYRIVFSTTQEYDVYIYVRVQRIQ